MRIELLGCIAILIAATAPGRAAEPASECWKAVFTEQLSGKVRIQRTSRAPNGYLDSYDGAFKWHGTPTKTPVRSEYLFCFNKSLDAGGELHVNGKAIAFDRIGSVKRPQGAQHLGLSTIATLQDPREYPALYAIFSTPGKPDSSMEIQLDRSLRKVAVIVGSAENRTRTVTYMQGSATPADSPASAP